MTKTKYDEKIIQKAKQYINTEKCKKNESRLEYKITLWNKEWRKNKIRTFTFNHYLL